MNKGGGGKRPMIDYLGGGEKLFPRLKEKRASEPL